MKVNVSQKQLLGGLVLLMCLSLCMCQRTYMRTCDCEYTVDGRCAYTLMLPGSVAGEGCPAGAQGGGELTERVEQVEKSVSQLVGLQGAVVTLQTLMLNGTNISRIDASQAGGSRDLAKLRDDMDVLQSRLVNVEQTANSVDDHQDYLSTKINELTDDLNSMTSRTDQLDVTSDEVKTRVSDVQAMMTKLQESGLLCYSRGLVVSGPVKQLEESDITVSSVFNADHGVDKLRINNNQKPGAWCPRKS